MPPVTSPADDLKWATHQFQPCDRRTNYHLFRNYYLGNHQLAFATEKFRSVFGQVFKEFSENACGSVVDALTDRLEILSFKSSEAELKVEDVPSNTPSVPTAPAGPGRKKVTVVDPIGEQALEIWRDNRMDGRANEVHQEALMMGDGYVIVWPNDEMEAEIWPQLATEVAVQYDPNNQKSIKRGTKAWWDEIEKTWFLNVYTPYGIYKYAQKSQAGEAARAIPQNAGGWNQIGFVNNPYRVVPIFHFPNRAIRKLGYSELDDVIPLQNGLNKSVMDLIISMEFASFKQRYVIGMELEIDEETGQPKDPNAKNYGVDRLMTITEPEAKVGQFDATDLTQFLEVQEKFWASIARVSGTPLHYFFITAGDFPSGEAMKSAEARFIKKIKDRQKAFGNVWEDVMLFALMINGTKKEGLRLETRWRDASPRSESELADTAVKKKAVGVSRSQILSELGYDDETILRMLEESDADSERNALMKASTEQEGVNPNGQPVPAGGGTQGVRRS